MNQELLKTLLRYSPETGEFFWINPTCRSTKPLSRAGSSDRHGYIRISLCRRSYQAHRLAWLYVYGRFPDHLIDHINGDRQDNRISNLRQATNKQNCENQKLHATNKSGYRGVVLHKRTGKWQAQVRHNGVNLYLGLYDTPEMAAHVVSGKRTELFTHYVGRDAA